MCVPRLNKPPTPAHCMRPMSKPPTPFLGQSLGGADCKISPPRRKVEKLRDPTPEALVKRCVRRLPTPPGDIIEVIRVRRQPQQIIERVVEQPRKPPPRIIERIETEPAPPPIIKNSCVIINFKRKIVFKLFFHLNSHFKFTFFSQLKKIHCIYRYIV
jgi:hypothetical protein